MWVKKKKDLDLFIMFAAVNEKGQIFTKCLFSKQYYWLSRFPGDCFHGQMGRKPDSKEKYSVIASIVDTLHRMALSQENKLWVKVKHSPSYLANNLSAIECNRKSPQV